MSAIAFELGSFVWMPSFLEGEVLENALERIYVSVKW
jgi:hypothetical protein